MKRIYFVRHGETVGNRDGYFQFPDTELSEAGHKGAEALAGRCEYLDIDAIVASSMRRAQQTASYVADLKSLPILTLDSLCERGTPVAVRGKQKDSIEGVVYSEAYATLYRQTDDLPEGFENYYAVIKRVKDSIDFLETHSVNNILVVSHGAFLHQLVAYLLLQKQDEMDTVILVSHSLSNMGNVGITEFDCTEGRWKLRTWNDRAHFAE